MLHFLSKIIDCSQIENAKLLNSNACQPETMHLSRQITRTSPKSLRSIHRIARNTPKILRSYHRPMLASLDDFWAPLNHYQEFFTQPTSLTLHRKSPGYHVVDDEQQFKLEIDVPGVKLNDIKIELKEHGRVLHVNGGRTVQTDNEFSTINFSKAFTLGPNIDSSNLTASLQNGVLTITTPKRSEVVQTINITNGDSNDLGSPTVIDVDKGEGEPQEKLEDQKGNEMNE